MLTAIKQVKPEVEHHHDIWDKIALLAFQAPIIVGVISGFGYLGHELLRSERNEKIDFRRLAGGCMVAVFSGYTTYLLMHATGMHDDLTVPISLIMGAGGEQGYKLLMARAKEIMKG